MIDEKFCEPLVGGSSNLKEPTMVTSNATATNPGLSPVKNWVDSRNHIQQISPIWIFPDTSLQVFLELSQ